ncbi:predicted protein [Coccidioides posadasii str. Silveira]|uniref:Predicted protein n=1 Tax=Coccidioides posadasii (strain RMSCC 757 / Silveira) TaxID=443226 RepID=E9CSV6_COCPS|nr:predicted protein [Coccidioides posadasii str. Silveira]
MGPYFCIFQRWPKEVWGWRWAWGWVHRLEIEHLHGCPIAPQVSPESSVLTPEASLHLCYVIFRMHFYAVPDIHFPVELEPITLLPRKVWFEPTTFLGSTCGSPRSECPRSSSAGRNLKAWRIPRFQAALEFRGQILEAGSGCVSIIGIHGQSCSQYYYYMAASMNKYAGASLGILATLSPYVDGPDSDKFPRRRLSNHQSIMRARGAIPIFLTMDTPKVPKTSSENESRRTSFPASGNSVNKGVQSFESFTIPENPELAPWFWGNILPFVDVNAQQHIPLLFQINSQTRRQPQPSLVETRCKPNDIPYADGKSRAVPQDSWPL